MFETAGNFLSRFRRKRIQGYHVRGLPLADIGLDQVYLINVQTGRARPLEGVILQKEDTLLEALQRDMKDGEILVRALDVGRITAIDLVHAARVDAAKN